jgi:hypothetical protein
MIDLLFGILIVGLLVFTFFLFTTLWLLIKYPKYVNKVVSKMIWDKETKK